MSGSQVSNSSKFKQKVCANPIFESWLSEWREDAAAKNSKLQYVYGKALSSLRKYPLHLPSGKACLILEFFGPSLAKMIDKRMAQENMGLDESGEGFPDVLEGDEYQKPTKKRARKGGQDTDQSQDIGEEESGASGERTKKVQKRNGKAYVPSYRSGPYSLLVAIGLRESKSGYRGYMTKGELVKDSQEHCESSMTRSDNPGNNYTAWSSMATLVSKGLILKGGHPTKYMLSPEGRELTSKLLLADHGVGLPTISEDSDGDGSRNSQDPLNSSANNFRTHMEPGQFEVVLYVDTSETAAKCKQDEVIGELRKNGVPLEVRRLSVGDFVWVCRQVVQSDPGAKRLTISRSAELVLPFVVERKRSDDLAHSIKDGRFHEQKFRLRKTGLQPIYLHEEYGKGQGDFGLADGALQQALANTQMTDDFLIQETTNIKDTCAYLTHMTRQLKKMYETKKVSSCTKQEWPTYKDRGSSSEIYLMIFSDFNDFGTKTKNWTTTEMFARHLMRLRGLSVERAHAIVQRYPTITALMKAYETCSSEKEREMLISFIHFGTSGRTVGPTISKVLSKLYNSPTLIT